MSEFIADKLDSRNKFRLTATDCREIPVNSCKGYLNIIHVSVTWFQNDFYAWKAKVTAYVAKTFGKSAFTVKEELGTILNHVTTSDTTSLEDTVFSPIVAQTSRQKYWHDPLLFYKASVTLNTLLFINRMRSFGEVTMAAKTQYALGKWSSLLNRWWHCSTVTLLNAKPESKTLLFIHYTERGKKKKKKESVPVWFLCLTQEKLLLTHQ